MPAGLPGDSLFNNQGNPNAGRFVTFDALSGPKDAPFDAKQIDYLTAPPNNRPAGWTAENIPLKINDDANISTGGLSTGVGFGSPPVIGEAAVGGDFPVAGFTDDYIPGLSTPVPADAPDARYMYIGGGRSEIVDGTGPDGNGYPPGWFTSQPDPYTAGFAICGAGNGGSRDSGANTGFPMKTVTATADVANGAVVEAGWVNRSGVEVKTGQSVFGSAVAANPAPA